MSMMRGEIVIQIPMQKFLDEFKMCHVSPNNHAAQLLTINGNFNTNVFCFNCTGDADAEIEKCAQDNIRRLRSMTETIATYTSSTPGTTEFGKVAFEFNAKNVCCCT